MTPPHCCVHCASALVSSRPGVPDDPRDGVLYQLLDGAQGHVLQPVYQPAVHLGQLPPSEVRGALVYSASPAPSGGGPFLIHQVLSFNFTMSRSYEDCDGENTSRAVRDRVGEAVGTLMCGTKLCEQ